MTRSDTPPLHPFTQKEYEQALRFVMSEAEARHLGRELTTPRSRPPEANISGISFTDETLILLSFVSASVKERVLAWCKPDAAWWARRAQLRQQLKIPDV